MIQIRPKFGKSRYSSNEYLKCLQILWQLEGAHVARSHGMNILFFHFRDVDNLLGCRLLVFRRVDAVSRMRGRCRILRVLLRVTNKTPTTLQKSVCVGDCNSVICGHFDCVSSFFQKYRYHQFLWRCLHLCRIFFYFAYENRNPIAIHLELTHSIRIRVQLKFATQINENHSRTSELVISWVL